MPKKARQIIADWPPEEHFVAAIAGGHYSSTNIERHDEVDLL